MKDDFAKILVERARHGHDRHYSEVRHMKCFDEEATRESMKMRYQDRKSFNEHLNPLRGWLRTCLGKNWDKCYSELRQKFDARSVVNNHILEHLFQYIQTDARLVDGVVMVPPQRYSNYGWEPVEDSGTEYYVCPKDGTVKRPKNQLSYRQIQRDRATAAKIELDKVFRVIDKDTHLRFIDGVWWVLTLKDAPVLKQEYVKPYGIETFKMSYESTNKARSWEYLTEFQKSLHGRLRLIGTPATDALTGEQVYVSTHVPSVGARKPIILRYGARYDVAAAEVGDGRYYATKQQASTKLLKSAGLVGTASANDETKFSHREKAKYRKAA